MAVFRSSHQLLNVVTDIIKVDLQGPFRIIKGKKFHTFKGSIQMHKIYREEQKGKNRKPTELVVVFSYGIEKVPSLSASLAAAGLHMKE